MGEISEIPSPGAPLAFGAVGAPGVVLVPDAFGRLPWLEPYAGALADQARLRAFVPDLYQGVATMDAEEAERLLAEFSTESALGEVLAAADTAHAEGATRVAVVGFGTGGRIALLAAQAGAADAVVAYDATLDEHEHTIIPAPVLLQLAEVAEWLPGADPEGFVDRLRDHGTPVARYDYTGAHPGFANATAGDAFDSRAAALAFARTAVFLEDRLHD